ncbi:MAG: helix-turn-helix transcriptional regulator [Clostridia bacterium]|nr:helix-turn-helix transcriptional regulator [Clostridia bacterium]
MIIHDSHAIGDKFYQIRRQYGKTQLEVATDAGLSDRTYSELERGIADVRISTVLKACDALHVTPNEIFMKDNECNSAREEDILARLQACNPQQKETALRILDAYLTSLT